MRKVHSGLTKCYKGFTNPDRKINMMARLKENKRVKEKRIINELTEQIALAMGWELMVDPQPLSDRGIIRKDEKSLYFRLDWKDKNRLEISGGFEGCAQYLSLLHYDNREKTDITVSRNNPIERIVKDIQNRLLPGYEKMLTYALECKTREDESKAWQQKELEEIAGLFKSATIQDERVFTFTPRPVVCKRWSDGEWDLTARLSKDKLIKILAVINEE